MALYGLSYGCPKDIARDSDCPFLEIEHLPFEEKIKWIDRLSDKKKESILKHHLKCTKEIKTLIQANT